MLFIMTTNLYYWGKLIAYNIYLAKCVLNNKAAYLAKLKT